MDRKKYMKKMDGWMDGYKKEKIYMEGWMDRKKDGWLDGWIEKIYEKKYRWLDG